MFKKRKSYDYFEGFHEFSKYTVSAAHYLNEILNSFDKKDLDNHRIKMHEIENNCDMHKHAVNAEIFKDTNPPIEAEDIINLNHLLDNVVDDLEDVLISLYIYDVEKIRKEAIVLSDIIVKLSDLLFHATSQFKKDKTDHKLFDFLKKIKQLELDADELYIEYMRFLYIEEKDFKQLLVWTRIYEILEVCIDSFESVSKQMEAIIIKNS